MMVPTVHLNGTSREALLEQVNTAYAAVWEALTALSAAWPNGRDYYPQGDAAYSEAVAEWDARAAKLRSVRDELRLLAEAIDRAGR